MYLTNIIKHPLGAEADDAEHGNYRLSNPNAKEKVKLGEMHR